MKLLIAMALAAAVSFPAVASAQTADFKCPATGTVFTFRSGGVDTQSTATGQDGDVCLIQRGSGDTETKVRMYWGLVGSVDAAGESFVRGLDLKSLWPLEVGNKTVQTVNGVGYTGQPYTSNVTITVAAYEQVTVPAGTFDAFRVEENKVGESRLRIHWWSPALGVSVKESFPDWENPAALKVYELAAVKQK
jgi:hypothetical protein